MCGDEEESGEQGSGALGPDPDEAARRRGRWCRRRGPGLRLHPERWRVAGADFTNTFHLLSSFPVGPEPQGMPEFLDALTAQCASLEELKLAFRPQMDPRWVPRSPFLGMGFRKERTIQNRACWDVGES